MKENISNITEYRPIRSLISCLLIIVFPFILFYELFGLSLEQEILFFTDFLHSINIDWIALFMERLINEPFKIFLVWISFIVLLYAFIQYAAIKIDIKYFGNKQLLNSKVFYTMERVIIKMSGRPTIDYDSKDKSLDNQNLQEHLEYGENSLMVPLRLSLSAFPMLGFLGTVVGLSGAIRYLPKAMQSEGALQLVLDNLYIAFDTTFLGLVGALISLLLIKLLEIQWDKLAQIHQAVYGS